MLLPAFIPHSAAKNLFVLAGINPAMRRYRRQEHTLKNTISSHDHQNDGIGSGADFFNAWHGQVRSVVVEHRLRGGEFTRVRPEGAPRAARLASVSFRSHSDSHMGFNKPANPDDVTGTLRASRGQDQRAAAHSGFHHSTPGIWRTPRNRRSSRHTGSGDAGGESDTGFFYVPGEHDNSVDDGKLYLERYGKGRRARGWYSFDHKGVHFVGLV